MTCSDVIELPERLKASSNTTIHGGVVKSERVRSGENQAATQTNLQMSRLAPNSPSPPPVLSGVVYASNLPWTAARRYTAMAGDNLGGRQRELPLNVFLFPSTILFKEHSHAWAALTPDCKLGGTPTSPYPPLPLSLSRHVFLC